MNNTTTSSSFFPLCQKDWSSPVSLKEYRANDAPLELLDTLYEYVTPNELLKVKCLQFKDPKNGDIFLWTIKPSRVFSSLRNVVNVQTKTNAFDTKVLDVLKQYDLIAPGCYTAHIIPLTNIIEQEVELTAWLKKNTKMSRDTTNVHLMSPPTTKTSTITTKDDKDDGELSSSVIRSSLFSSCESYDSAEYEDVMHRGGQLNDIFRDIIITNDIFRDNITSPVNTNNTNNVNNTKKLSEIAREKALSTIKQRSLPLLKDTNVEPPLTTTPTISTVTEKDDESSFGMDITQSKIASSTTKKVKKNTKKSVSVVDDNTSQKKGKKRTLEKDDSTSSSCEMPVSHGKHKKPRKNDIDQDKPIVMDYFRIRNERALVALRTLIQDELIDQPKPFIHVLFTQHYYNDCIVEKLKRQTDPPVNVEDYENDLIYGKHLRISMNV